jgi:hypothetical protein
MSSLTLQVGPQLFSKYLFGFCFFDQRDLFGEHVTKARENGNKQIDLGQGSAALSLSAQKEFDLDSAPTIGNGKHVVAPPVFAFVGGFNLSEDMRRIAS